MWQEDYSLTELARALSTVRPSSIRVSSTGQPSYFKWVFSWPSALRVIVVLSASQSLTMERSIASTSEIHLRPQIIWGEQLTLFMPWD